MKYKTHFTIVITSAVLSLLLTSCSIEKRHYRNGYYMQHSTGLVNRKCVQNNPADSENHIELMRVNINSERADSIVVTSNADCRENNVTDFTALARTVNEVSEQNNVVIENKICSENKGQSATIAKVNDDVRSSQGKQRTGAALTILGAILVVIGLIGMVMTGAIVAGIVLVPLGVLFLCLGIRKKQRSKTRGQKKKLKLWAKILIGIALLPLALFLYVLIYFAVDFGLQ